MIIKIKSSILVMYLILGSVQAITAADNITNKDAAAFSQSSADMQKYLGIYSACGTHRNALGIEGYLNAYTDVQLFKWPGINPLYGVQDSLGLSGKIDAVYYEKDFGIPGDKFTGKLQLSALYTSGPLNSLFTKYPLIIGNRMHNFKFGYTGYLTTDSTSQITGQLDYLFIKDKNVFMLNYENDTMLFYLTDKYRTAAFKISYLYDMGTDIIGASLGFNLWAGERNTLWTMLNDGSIQFAEEVNRENEVTLFNANEYSVDLVFLSFIFNNYCISFGYDSEIFKKIIHNNIHYVLNDGHLPILDRPDKFYIEFRTSLPYDLF